MDNSNVTITLPLTGHGLGVILTALGIGVGTGIVWLMLSEQGRAPHNSPANLLGAFAVIMAPVWLVIFAGTLWQVWLMLSGAPSASGSGPSLGMGALLGAPFLVWGTVLKQRTVDFQKEGHITDRITAAVEQLGAEKTVKKIVDGATQETSEPNIEVRIGAILSLERIAQDSTRYDKGRDHVRVMEILCAYIRENSNATPPRDFPLPEWEPLPDDATEMDRKVHEDWRKARFENGFDLNAREWAQSLPNPRADIAQTLQVLGRRTAEQRQIEDAWPNSLDTNTSLFDNLSSTDFFQISKDDHLAGAKFESAKRRLTILRANAPPSIGYKLNLSGANLQGTDLSAKGLDASDAVFSGAILRAARMEGADLSGARMEAVNLESARMEGASLFLVQMKNALLCDTRMEGVDLSCAQLEGADFCMARLEG